MSENALFAYISLVLTRKIGILTVAMTVMMMTNLTRPNISSQGTRAAT